MRLVQEREERKRIATEAIIQNRLAQNSFFGNPSFTNFGRGLGLISDPMDSPGFIGTGAEREQALANLNQSGLLDSDSATSMPIPAMSLDDSGNIINSDFISRVDPNYVNEVVLTNDGYFPAELGSTFGREDTRTFDPKDLPLEERIKVNEDMKRFVKNDDGSFSRKMPFYEERKGQDSFGQMLTQGRQDSPVIDPTAKVDPTLLQSDASIIAARPYSAAQQADLARAENIGTSYTQVPGMKPLKRGAFESLADFNKRSADYNKAFSSYSGVAEGIPGDNVLSQVYDLESGNLRSATNTATEQAGGLLDGMGGITGAVGLLGDIMLMQSLLDNKQTAAPAAGIPRGQAGANVQYVDPYKRRF